MQERAGWSDRKAIGASAADTTSNGGRGLDFPAALIAAGNGREMETIFRRVYVCLCASHY